MKNIISAFISQIENQGYASCSFKVDGYWSEDPISFRVDRSYCYDTETYSWEIKGSHSSGGRDGSCDDTTAIRNFGKAMVEMAELMEEASYFFKEFDCAYKEYEAKRKAAEEARRKELEDAKLQDRIDHPSMGEEEAIKLAEKLYADVKNGKVYSDILVAPRHACENKWRFIWASAEQHSRSIRFKINGKSLSRKEFIDLLADEYVIGEE